MYRLTRFPVPCRCTCLAPDPRCRFCPHLYCCHALTLAVASCPYFLPLSPSLLCPRSSTQAAQNVLAQKWVHPDQPLRQLQLSDLEAALAHVKPSTTRADEYGTSDHARRYSGAGVSTSGSPLPSVPESLVWELLAGGGDLNAANAGASKGQGAALAALAAAAAAAAAANVQQARPKAGSSSSSPGKASSTSSRRPNGVASTSSQAPQQNGCDAADSSNDEYEEAQEGEAAGGQRQQHAGTEAAAALLQLLLQQQAAGAQ